MAIKRDGIPEGTSIKIAMLCDYAYFVSFLGQCEFDSTNAVRLRSLLRNVEGSMPWIKDYYDEDTIELIEDLKDAQITRA